MPILQIGAAMMDTERMLPSQMNGGSPGSNQSGGQLSNGPGGGGGRDDLSGESGGGH